MGCDELRRLRQELNEEEAKLGAIEEDINLKSNEITVLREEYLGAVESIIYKHQPELLPLLAKRTSLEERKSFVESQVEWLSNKAVEQDKLASLEQFDELKALMPYAMEALRITRDKLNEAYDAFDQKCSLKALKTVSDYDCPPPVAIDVMRTVSHIRNEPDDSWDASRVLLTSNYFVEFFRRRSEQLMKERDVLPESSMEELERFCEDPMHSLDALYRASEPIGVFGQWIRATRDFYRVRYFTAPLLLMNKSAENAEAIHEVCRRLTFGLDVKALEAPEPIPAIESTPAETPAIEATPAATTPAAATPAVQSEQASQAPVEQLAEVPAGETNSQTPSLAPSQHPSLAPSQHPSQAPSQHPSLAPSQHPSQAPSQHPSQAPSQHPSQAPSQHPSQAPSQHPSLAPSQHPSLAPSQHPSLAPSQHPSLAPSQHPSLAPSQHPSLAPSQHPSLAPSQHPSLAPSQHPSLAPSQHPSQAPSQHPSQAPVAETASGAPAGEAFSQHSEGQVVVPEQALVLTEDSAEGQVEEVRPSAMTQLELRELEKFRNQLQEEIDAAQKEIEEVENTIKGELKHLREQYDPTMMSIEDELEDKVVNFIETFMDCSFGLNFPFAAALDARREGGGWAVLRSDVCRTAGGRIGRDTDIELCSIFLFFVVVLDSGLHGFTATLLRTTLTRELRDNPTEKVSGDSECEYTALIGGVGPWYVGCSLLTVPGSSPFLPHTHTHTLSLPHSALRIEKQYKKLRYTSQSPSFGGFNYSKRSTASSPSHVVQAVTLTHLPFFLFKAHSYVSQNGGYPSSSLFSMVAHLLPSVGKGSSELDFSSSLTQLRVVSPQDSDRPDCDIPRLVRIIHTLFYLPPLDEMASEELMRLRDELAQEQAHLSALEEDVELKAAQLGYLHEEYVANMEKVIYFYQPQLLPRLATVNENKEKIVFVQAQIAWLEKKVIEQEKRLRVGVFVEARDMKGYADDVMRPVLDALADAYEAFDKCSDKALVMMSNYSCPPDVAIETMRMVMRVRGEEDDSWKASQVLLTNNYFKAFFVSRSESLMKTKDLLDEPLMEELERYCEKPEHAVDQLYKSSEPIGVLGKWLRAVRDFYRVRYYTAPVLLQDTTYASTKKAREVCRRLTFGVTGALVIPGQDKNAVEPISDEPEDSTQLPVRTQAEIKELRHLLHQLNQKLSEAQQKVNEIGEQIKGELSELRESYDSTMLPIEYQLEDKTASFTSLLSLM
eukprot:gene11972-8245_t